MRPKIAIFDLTDCEGCELEFLNFKKALLDFDECVDLINWRLLQVKAQSGPFDITFVEGNPLTPEEIQLLKSIRKKSKYLIALGACACVGGVQAALDSDSRKMYAKKIYNSSYKLKADNVLPINKYIQVDFYINGCPVNPKEIEEVVTSLLAYKNPKIKDYPVCLECKASQNKCLLINSKPCLGPITRGGCGAICIKGGIPCFGCWGPTSAQNYPALKKTLSNFMNDHEIKKRIKLIQSAIKEYQDE